MEQRRFPPVILVAVVLAGLLLAPMEPARAQAAEAAKTDSEGNGARLEAPPSPLKPVVLRYAYGVADLGTRDPHFAATTQDRAVADMLFNGLLRYQPGNAPSIEPDLAEEVPEPEIEKGKQTWTFKLRKGVFFHPGPKTGPYELTADDVVYSFRKSADPQRSAYAGEYTGMNVEKVDPYTVRIVLEKPLSPLLFLPKVTNYSGGFIVSRKAVEIMGDEAFQSHPIGTGPFMYESCTANDRVRLVANRGYFRGRPLLDAVEIVFLPDVADREAAFKAGKVDCFWGKVEKAWIDRMEEEEGVKVDLHGPGEIATLYFNTTRKPFDDARVRKAVAYALNRDASLSHFGREVILEKVYSPVPGNLLPGGLTEAEVRALGLDYAPDPAKAGQLLAEAGYPNGFSLEVVTSGQPIYRLSYEAMKLQLAHIGIELTIKPTDHSTMHRLIREDANPLVVYSAWRPNADNYLTRFFHSDSIVMTGARPDTNFSHYDKIDRLIEAARLETQPGRQIELWKQAQIKVLDDMAAYPLYQFKMVDVRKAYVDYGHDLVSVMPLYPQFTEKTRIVK